MAVATTDDLEEAVVDLLQGSTLSAFDYVGTGIGTTGAAVTDSALENTTGAPSQVQGTMTQPSANVHRVTATVSYTSTLAITEVGLFNNDSTQIMGLRSTFSALNVVSGDSIIFTINTTVTASVT